MAAKKNVMKNIGACLVRIGMVDVKPNETIELTDEQLNSQGVKSLLHREVLEFEDDPKRTRELLEVIRKKAKPKEEKTIEQREKAPDIE